MKITAEDNGKKITLDLTDGEVKQALSVMKTNQVDDLFIVKKHNGAAMFFVNAQNAYNCGERIGVDYTFKVEKKVLVQKQVPQKGNGGK